MDDSHDELRRWRDAFDRRPPAEPPVTGVLRRRLMGRRIGHAHPQKQARGGVVETAPVLQDPPRRLRTYTRAPVLLVAGAAALGLAILATVALLLLSSIVCRTSPPVLPQSETPTRLFPTIDVHGARYRIRDLAAVLPQAQTISSFGLPRPDHLHNVIETLARFDSLQNQTASFLVESKCTAEKIAQAEHAGRSAVAARPLGLPLCRAAGLARLRSLPRQLQQLRWDGEEDPLWEASCGLTAAAEALCTPVLGVDLSRWYRDKSHAPDATPAYRDGFSLAHQLCVALETLQGVACPGENHRHWPPQGVVQAIKALEVELTDREASLTADLEVWSLDCGWACQWLAWWQWL